jgi:hypothetical protein
VVACIVDPAAHASATAELQGPTWSARAPTGSGGASTDATARDVWAVERALREHEIETHVLTRSSDLGAQIVTARGLAQATVR